MSMMKKSYNEVQHLNMIMVASQQHQQLGVGAGANGYSSLSNEGAFLMN
jgi:hypothetical protein